MKIDTYRSTRSGTKLLSVPAGTDIGKFRFPLTLDPDFGKLIRVNTSTDIQAGEEYFSSDSDEVIRQINEKGFATHTSKGVKSKVTITR